MEKLRAGAPTKRQAIEPERRLNPPPQEAGAASSSSGSATGTATEALEAGPTVSEILAGRTNPPVCRGTDHLDGG